MMPEPWKTATADDFDFSRPLKRSKEHRAALLAAMARRPTHDVEEWADIVARSLAKFND